MVRPIQRSEEPRFQRLMLAHRYLDALPKIGDALWYVAPRRDEWVALLSSRFLILPSWHFPVYDF